MAACENSDSMGAAVRPHRRVVPRKGEDGFVLVFSAIFMTILVGFAGFSVDLGNWYLHAERLQRAADAAALSGAVYLPGDAPKAEAVARNTLKNNGVTSGVTVAVKQSGTHPTQLEVTLDQTVPNYFASVFGLKSIELSRTGTAEWSLHVPMGSPSNVLGIEWNPSDSWEKASIKSQQNHYWIDQAGPADDKIDGDRYSSGDCGSGWTINCDDPKPKPLRNLDYQADGAVYVVRVPPSVAGTLVLQAYDPGLTMVGDECMDSRLDGASAYGSLYAKGDLPQCSGDSMDPLSATPHDTTFTMFTPEISAGGSQKITTAGCTSQTFPGYKGKVVDKLKPSAPTYDPAFVASFRKWVPLCQMYVDGGVSGGDYLLKVTTGPSGTLGQNRYALRVGIMTGATLDTTRSSQLQLFARDRLVVFVRESSKDVTFFLARLDSSTAGKRVSVSLFDIGDTDGTAKLQLLPPPDAKRGSTTMSSFPTCTYTPAKTSTTKPTGSSCTISGITNAQYNGQMVQIYVNVPSDYTCADSDPNGCWMRLRLTYTDNVWDNTSWEVTAPGNPLHIVQNE
jgi:hypothetical protein